MSNNYNFFEKEAQVRQWWEDEKTYSYAPDADKQVFSIDTPPPTVSGSLHIGHIFSYTQTDIIARYKRLSGFSVFYPFGFDNNGLPTERFVEKKRGITAFSAGRKAFQEACLEETKNAEDGFIQLWKTMGFSIDWDYCYSTISSEVQALSQKSFIELYKKGYVYRKEEPALYCTACRTSVAQAELEDVEKETFFSKILFYTQYGQALEVATTRPELLASCVTVFCHPDDSRYQHLIGKEILVPLYDFYVPIRSDDKVIPEKGTGLVMCCTFGDTLDVYWFKKYKLPFKQSIDFNGTMKENTGPLKGLTVLQAREKILALLLEKNLVTHQEKIKHTVSVYERSKKEIEYMMLSQWFLDILSHKNQLIKIADTINWFPLHMKQRYVNWVENLQWDWCLSRQRTFGIPFPVWYDPETGEPIMADINALPVDPQSLSPVSASGKTLIPDSDVMDTWNTSSITPYICKSLVEKKGYSFSLPMNMRPQAHDIIRTWAFYTIIKAWMHDGIIPWNDIVISGHVITSDKQKISKSKGNNPTDPAVLLATQPADVIRYWTASSNLGIDTAFSETQFKNGNRLLIKLLNAGIFVKQNRDATLMFSSENFEQPVHRWISDRLMHVYKEYCVYFDAYEYSLALGVVEKFFWSDFCDNYLELIKHQLFNSDCYKDEQVKETKYVLAKVYHALLKLFSPVLPHITEYLNRDVLGNSLSLEATGYDFNFFKEDNKISDSFDRVIDLIGQVRKNKSEMKLSLKVEIEDLFISVSSDEESSFVESVVECIARAVSAKNVHIKVAIDCEPVDQYEESAITIKKMVVFLRTI